MSSILRLASLCALTLAGLFMLAATAPEPQPRVSAAVEAEKAEVLTAQAEADTNEEAVKAAIRATQAKDNPVQAAQAGTESVIGTTGGATVTPASLTNEPGWVVTGNAVNLRRGPSTSTPVVGSVRGGDRVKAIGDTTGDWVQIEVNGQRAYIFGKFLAEAPQG